MMQQMSTDFGVRLFSRSRSLVGQMTYSDGMQGSMGRRAAGIALHHLQKLHGSWHVLCTQYAGTFLAVVGIARYT